MKAFLNLSGPYKFFSTILTFFVPLNFTEVCSIVQRQRRPFFYYSISATLPRRDFKEVCLIWMDIRDAPVPRLSFGQLIIGLDCIIKPNYVNEC